MTEKKKKYFLFVVCFLTFFIASAQTKATKNSVLLDTQLVKNNWSIVSQSLINIRKDPDYRAEMTTQALLGTPIKLLGKKYNWKKIETPDGYIGWTSAPLQLMDSIQLHQFNKKPRLIVTQNNSVVYTKSDVHSEILSEVVLGSIVALASDKMFHHFYKVSFADGRQGFIEKSAVAKWNDWQKSIELTGKSLEKLSAKFLGVPYFWGGTSPRGLDCSGLTKTSYFMHGIILPRDASQQYLIGTAIDSVNHFSQLQKGDLLFFGRKDKNDTTQYKIVHTGIYLQNRQFIHASDGYVQISSLNPSDENYDQNNHSRFVIAKRIINQPLHTGFWNIFTHPWYQ